MDLHTVYWTTNLVNGKFYIGVHKTKNPFDDYLGSGKRLGRARCKYGDKNFKKEVLIVHGTAEEALVDEAYLVAKHIDNPLCMNLKSGGSGGFDYINKHCKRNREWSVKGGKASQLSLKAHCERDKEFEAQYLRNRFGGPNRIIIITDERKAELSEKAKEMWARGVYKPHSQEVREKLSLSHRGEKNSQFGTCWISKEGERRKIKRVDLEEWIKLGWQNGKKKIPKEQKPLIHGTTQGYHRSCRCTLCKAAWSAYHREYYSKHVRKRNK